MANPHKDPSMASSQASPASRRRAAYSTLSRGHLGQDEAEQSRAASSAGVLTRAGPETLESLDDLIREEQQRSASMPASASAAQDDSDLIEVDAEHLSASTTTTLRPPSIHSSPQRSRLSIPPDHVSSGFSQRTIRKPRDESRWNGWHLWRMESYNRRVSAQQHAEEQMQRAEQWKRPLKYIHKLLKRVAAPFSGGAGSVNGSHISHADSADDAIGVQKVPLYRMILVTLVLAGVQVAWCLEFGYGTPYLLSIGLSKSAVSLVWLAAPTSGLIVQPLVGVLSDMSTSPCRRRQYILGSSLIVVICAIVLAFSDPFASMLTDVLHAGLADWDPVRLRARDDMNRFLAVVAFITLDLSINGVQAASRALILDVTPSQLHSQVNAWAARMMHGGSVLGYASGWYDLSSARWLRWIGGGQFRKYSLISLLFVALSSIITCLSVLEGPTTDEIGDTSDSVENGAATGAATAIRATTSPLGRSYDPPFSERVSGTVSHVWQSIRRLPRPVRTVCAVQLFAHMGWFPFLVYATQWVIETRQQARSRTLGGIATNADDRATEVGSFALLMFAVVSLTSGIILPHVAMSHRPERSVRLEGAEHERASDEDARPRKRFFGFKTWRVTLRSLWRTSLVFYGLLATIGTFFVQTVQHAIILVALVGIPWSVAVWVPYALVMESVREAEDGASPYEFEADWFAPQNVRQRRRDSLNRRRSGSLGSRARAERALRDCGPLGARSSIHNDRSRLPGSILARGGHIVGGSTGDGRIPSGIDAATTARTDTAASNSTEDMDGSGHLPLDRNVYGAIGEDSVGGTILGIHNMSIVIPQLLIALLAAVILRDRDNILSAATQESGMLASLTAGNGDGVDVVWIIRVGGLASFVAAWLINFVATTRTERMVMAALDGRPFSDGAALNTQRNVHPRFDDEASDGEVDDAIEQESV